MREISEFFSLYVTPIKLGSYRSSVSGAFLYVRNRFPSLLYLLVMMLDHVIAGCLENSDLETSDHRPRNIRTRKLRPQNFRPLQKRLKIVNAVLQEGIYFFTIIIIVTNPKCQIAQQFRIDNCRQVKGFLYFYSKQKRERQEQWQNYFSFSCVISGKKWPELPGQCNDRCHTNLQATEIHAR